MNEVEAYELFSIAADHIEQLFYGFFSLVTAFLVMTYLAADKLDRVFSVIVVSFYSLCCLWFFIATFAWRTDGTSLYAEMLLKKSNGVYEMEWFGNNPDWMSVVATGLNASLIVGGWLVSIGYFIYRRRQVRMGGT